VKGRSKILKYANQGTRDNPAIEASLS